MSHHVPVTRRGGFLLLIGSIYAVVGFAYATPAVPTGNTDRNSAYTLAEHFGSLALWGALWCLSGLCACIAAFYPKEHDQWGFLVLVGWSVFWGLMACGSTIVYGAERGWVAGAIWLTFAGACGIVSGMDRIGARPWNDDGGSSA